VAGGTLNRMGINVLRDFPDVGPVVWGARTSVGADGTPGDWKYVPVRRSALFIESSVERGLQWTVFEPNGEPLWAAIRDGVGTFLHGLFRAGAFAGNRSSDAWFVQCDGSTTTQSDIGAGRVNVTIGFAPARPAEFVVIRIWLAAAKPSA
jgi:phage tail sheath protein FI